jgi:hypothetical protein
LQPLDSLTLDPPNYKNQQANNTTGLLDYAAPAHYGDQGAEQHCVNVSPTTTGPSVQVANGHIIEPNKRVTIPLAPELSADAKIGHLFNNLQSGTLISLGQLCGDECDALFTKYDVKIYKHGQVIIVGKRNPTNGLWNIPRAPKEAAHPLIPLPTPKTLQHSANGVIQNINTKQDLAAFHHGSAYSPVPSTLLWAIGRGHFHSWPGLTTGLVSKHLAKALATSKGHLRMQQKNVQSTKIATSLPLATSLDVSPSQEPHNMRTNVIFAAIMPFTDLRKSYSDQTGKFPVQSSRGYNYVMVLYDFDSNAILSRPTKTKEASKMTATWTELHEHLRSNGYAPDLHILDNECSHELKKAFQKYNVAFQRVPPHVHRQNAAERAIQTWKNHFCAGLATCGPKFPLLE